MVSLIVFVFGLVIGSFLNAFIHRLEKGESALRVKSYCDCCKHLLAWYDLIPLLSFLVLKGRCRYCKEKISFQHPLVELVTALVFVLLALSFPKFGLSLDNFILSLTESNFPQVLELLYLWAIGAILVAVFVYDLKHFLIPDILVYAGVGLAIVWRVFEFLNVGNFETLVSALIAGFGASAFFLAVYLVSKGRAMGFGDVKLAFLLGLFLRWPSILVALFAAFCLGALVGIVLIVLKKKGLRSEVPFAPFLIMGTAIAFFFGESILHWYLSLFLV